MLMNMLTLQVGVMVAGIKVCETPDLVDVSNYYYNKPSFCVITNPSSVDLLVSVTHQHSTDTEVYKVTWHIHYHQHHTKDK
jgi:hypothetical protein